MVLLWFDNRLLYSISLFFMFHSACRFTIRTIVYMGPKIVYRQDKTGFLTCSIIFSVKFFVNMSSFQDIIQIRFDFTFSQVIFAGLFFSTTPVSKPRFLSVLSFLCLPIFKSFYYSHFHSKDFLFLYCF